VRNITLLIFFLLTAIGFSHFKPVNYFSPIISSSFFQKPSVNFSYKSGTLKINGVEGSGLLKVYTIIGNEVLSLNIQDFSALSIPVSLQRQNMYIIRIVTLNNDIYTFKIVAN